MKISILVPTYRRPVDLERCLAALERQIRRADQVVVVARTDDEQSWAVINKPWKFPITPVRVSRPGVVAALNAGFDCASGNILAITDDDAAPHPDWLARIEAHFVAHADLGGVGGRDWVYHGDSQVRGSKNLVGKIQWFGRIVGNHHLGVGPPREVDVLKGVNWSFRREAIEHLRLDEELRGEGAQVHNELAFSLAVQRRGWKLLYDPAVAVNHYPGVRHDVDQRNRFHPEATFNTAFNSMWATQRYLKGWRCWSTRQWMRLVGTAGEPGWAHFLRSLATGDRTASERFRAARGGRSDALSLLRQSR